jgi:hypothetical protein
MLRIMAHALMHAWGMGLWGLQGLAGEQPLHK